MPLVYIILVNWNGWGDTVECLESIFRLKYPAFRVIICDNASEDSSLDRIAEWAEGRLAANCFNPDLRHFSSPPCYKPIPFVRVPSAVPIGSCSQGAKLLLLQTNANLGFAGANNLGLQLALADSDFDYAWLLNNDTVVDPEALSALVDRVRNEPDAGICGSTILFYDRPNTIQAFGGSIYNPWTGRGGHIGLGDDWNGPPARSVVEHRMKYVVGASMLVSRRFLEDVGLMNPSYFLYFEEVDWATRARGRFSLAYAPGSVIYHKEGRSIGSSSNRATRSLRSEYYSARSCMMLTKRYLPAAIPSVMFSLIARSLFRLIAGNVPAAKAILLAVLDSLRREPDRVRHAPLTPV
jgi:GT2 family glycosyltransferase